MSLINHAREPGISAEGRVSTDPFLDTRPSLQSAHEAIEEVVRLMGRIARRSDSDDDALMAHYRALQCRAHLNDLIDAEGK